MASLKSSSSRYCNKKIWGLTTKKWLGHERSSLRNRLDAFHKGFNLGSLSAILPSVL